MIKKLNSHFSYNDDRGKIYGILNNFSIEEINFIDTYKGTIRGNHYHKKTTEIIFIIDGNVKVIYQSISKKVELEGKGSIIVRKNDIFLIEPYIIHTFIAQEDSKWINALTVKHNPNNPDFYKINLT